MHSAYTLWLFGGRLRPVKRSSSNWTGLWQQFPRIWIAWHINSIFSGIVRNSDILSGWNRKKVGPRIHRFFNFFLLQIVHPFLFRHPLGRFSVFFYFMILTFSNNSESRGDDDEVQRSPAKVWGIFGASEVGGRRPSFLESNVLQFRQFFLLWIFII